MFRGHTPTKDLPETLLSVYMAKKRADEVAPGVGEDTDMFSIGPQPGTYGPLARSIQDRLATEYRKLRQREERATTKAEEGMKDHVETILRESAEAARAAQAASPQGLDDGGGAADEGPVRDEDAENEPEVAP
jgi:hypothetical protein